MRFLLGLALAALPASLIASVPRPDACPPGQVAVPISSAPGPVTITEDMLLRGTTCAPAASPPISPPSAYTPPVPVQRKPIQFVHAGELRLVSLNPPSPTALAQTTSSRVIERTYDDFDRVKSELVPLEDGTNWQIRYTYWKNGLRKTMMDMVGRVTFYEYDGQARLSRVTANQGLPNEAVTTYEYWPDDLLKRIVAPNGVVTSYGYDLADRVTSILIEHGTATLASYAYTYDANGNRLSQTETNGGAPELTTYTYDARDRLTSVTYPGGSSVTYGYDDVGNRTSETSRNPVGEVVSDKTAVFDAVNRLSSVTDLVDPSNDATFTYDANGNLTSKTTASGTESYDYDVRDLMVESRSGPTITARFAYDAFGRRYLKVTGDEFTPVVRQYLYDQTSVLHELDSGGVEVAKYEYGGDRLLSLTRPDEGRRFYHQDALGSVVVLSDDAGAVVARYHLDAWGRYRTPSELDASANRFGFTGYLFDQETDLYWAKARFYDPEYGRFTSQDSVLGEVNEPPSLHRYFYGYANPLRYIDPTGHVVKAGQGFLLGDEPLLVTATDEATVHANPTDAQLAEYAERGEISRSEAVFGQVGNRTRALATTTPDHQKSWWRNFAEDSIENVLWTITAPAHDTFEGLARQDPKQFGTGVLTQVGTTAVGVGLQRGLGLLVERFPRLAKPLVLSEGRESVEAASLSAARPLAAEVEGFAPAPLASTAQTAGQSVQTTAPVGFADKAEYLVELQAAQHAEVTLNLQRHVSAAARAVDSQGLTAFTLRQQRAIVRQPSLRPAFRGNRIDVRARRDIMADPTIRGQLPTLRSQYTNGPDFSEFLTGRWWDMTTSRQWPAHQLQYGSSGTHLDTR